jgi:Fe-S-cluster containining protein
MTLPTCADACCQYGVDVSTLDRERITRRSAEVAALLDGRTDWFDPEVSIEEPDEEFPDGRVYRTLVAGRGCVFLNPRGRGCVLHALGLKPRVCQRAFFSADGKTLDEDVEWLPCKPQWLEELRGRARG